MDLDHHLFWVLRHPTDGAVARVPRLAWSANRISTLHQVDEPELGIPLTLARATLGMLHQEKRRKRSLVGQSPEKVQQLLVPPPGTAAHFYAGPAGEQLVENDVQREPQGGVT